MANDLEKTKVLGTYAAAASIEVRKDSALDPRLTWANNAEIFNIQNWPHDGSTVYSYEGMVVSVGSNVYVLKDKAVWDAALNAETVDATAELTSCGWSKVGDQANIEALEEIIGKPSENGEEATGVYKDIEDIQNALGAPAVEGVEGQLGTPATGIYKDIEDINTAIGTKEESHSATADDVNAGTADKIGEKVIDTEASGIYKEIDDAVSGAMSEIIGNDSDGTGNITLKGVYNRIGEAETAISDLQDALGDDELETSATSIKGAINEIKSAIDNFNPGNNVHIKEITEGLDAGVAARYALVDEDDNLISEDYIDIPKDKYLENVEAVTEWPAHTEGDEEIPAKTGQFLKFTYQVDEGTKEVYLDWSQMLVESEFGDGLAVSEGGVVSVKSADANVIVSESGVAVKTVSVSAAKGKEIEGYTNGTSTITKSEYDELEEAEKAAYNPIYTEEVNGLATALDVKNAIEAIDIQGGSDGKYVPGVDGAMTATTSGGLTATTGLIGMTADSLKGKTYSELFDAILFPTVQPTITKPSIKFTGTNFTSAKVDAKVGDTYTLPDAESNVTSSAGSWSNNTITPVILTGSKTVSVSPALGEGNVIEAKSSYTVTASQAFTVNEVTGVLDNKGNQATVSKYTGTSPMKASYTIYPYYPIYATTSTTGDLVELTFDSASMRGAGIADSTPAENKITVELAASSADKAQQIKVPGTIDGLEFEVNKGNWNAAEVAEWTSVLEDDGLYRTYTRSGQNGVSKFRFAVKKNA